MSICLYWDMSIQIYHQLYAWHMCTYNLLGSTNMKTTCSEYVTNILAVLRLYLQNGEMFISDFCQKRKNISRRHATCVAHSSLDIRFCVQTSSSDAEPRISSSCHRSHGEPDDMIIRTKWTLKKRLLGGV